MKLLCRPGVLAADALFILVHISHVYATYFLAGSMRADPNFSLEQDGGYGERFEYAKLLFCIFAMTAGTTQPVYAALAIACGFMFADNAFELHERVGGSLSPALAFAEKISPGAPQALAEVAFLAVVGIAALALLLAAFWRSAAAHRAAGLLCVGLIGLFAAFAVGVDPIHALLGTSPVIDRAFGLVEDGGELVVLSLICAVSMALFARLVPGRAVAQRP